MAWTELDSTDVTDTAGDGTIRTVTTTTYVKASGNGYLVRVDKTVHVEYNSDGVAGLEDYYGVPATSLCYCFDPDAVLTVPSNIVWTETETDTQIDGETQTLRGHTYTGQPQDGNTPTPNNLPGVIHRVDRTMEDENAVPLVGSIALAWELT